MVVVVVAAGGCLCLCLFGLFAFAGAVGFCYIELFVAFVAWWLLVWVVNG